MQAMSCVSEALSNPVVDREWLHLLACKFRGPVRNVGLRFDRTAFALIIFK